MFGCTEGGVVSPVVTDSSLLTTTPQQTQFVETQATTFRHPLPQQPPRMPTLDPRMQVSSQPEIETKFYVICKSKVVQFMDQKQKSTKKYLT